jgi:CDP-6-deoxy-D-xylo-4-hexulose-3-dehydrase
MNKDSLRKKILTAVEEYYKEAFTEKPFTAGDKISYAGRIFDEHELVNLVDSSLDFWLTAGRYSKQFEDEFSKTLGVKFTKLVNSGSSANLIAVSSLGSSLLKNRLVEGDEIITVAAGFPTTIAPILQNGFVPVFVDVSLPTYNIDVSQLELAYSPKTRAVFVAHTLGNPFDLGAVQAFCKKYNLWMIEDNCDALGALYNGKPTGSFGDLSTHSFYPAHHITMGEGGTVCTSNAMLSRVSESFRDWGRDCWCASGEDNCCKKRFEWELGTLPKGYDHKYIYRHFGYNLKATDMQAAVGVAQLEKLSHFVKQRRKNWDILYHTFKPFERYVVLPEPTPNSVPSWFGFLITVKDDAPFSRHDIVRHLESQGIQTRGLFSGNILCHPAFDDIRNNPKKYRVIGNLETTNRIMNHTFWLGVYPGLTSEKMAYIQTTITDFLKKYA